MSESKKTTREEKKIRAFESDAGIVLQAVRHLEMLTESLSRRYGLGLHFDMKSKGDTGPAAIVITCEDGPHDHFYCEKFALILADAGCVCTNYEWGTQCNCED